MNQHPLTLASTYTKPTESPAIEGSVDVDGVDQIMADLNRLRIKIKIHGNCIRYSPRANMTKELAGRMKAHKAGLLAKLQSTGADWEATLNRLQGDPLFPADLIAVLRSAHVQPC